MHDAPPSSTAADLRDSQDVPLFPVEPSNAESIKTSGSVPTLSIPSYDASLMTARRKYTKAVLTYTEDNPSRRMYGRLRGCSVEEADCMECHIRSLLNTGDIMPEGTAPSTFKGTLRNLVLGSGIQLSVNRENAEHFLKSTAQMLSTGRVDAFPICQSAADAHRWLTNNTDELQEGLRLVYQFGGRMAGITVTESNYVAEDPGSLAPAQGCNDLDTVQTEEEAGQDGWDDLVDWTAYQ